MTEFVPVADYVLVRREDTTQTTGRSLIVSVNQFNQGEIVASGPDVSDTFPPGTRIAWPNVQTIDVLHRGQSHVMFRADIIFAKIKVNHADQA